MAGILGITTDLHSLSVKGDIKTITESWSKYSDQLDHYKSGFTPLQEASRKGHYRVVEFLLSKGAKVNALSSKKETALFYAAEGRHTECELLLMRYRSDLSIGDLTPLSTGDSEFLSFLQFKDVNVASKADYIHRITYAAIMLESMHFLEKVATLIPTDNLLKLTIDAEQAGKHRSTAFLLLVQAAVNNDIELVERLYGMNKTGNALSPETRKVAHLISTRVPLIMAKKLNHVSVFDSILTKTGLKRSRSTMEVSWDRLGINHLSPQILSQISKISHWSLSHNNLHSIDLFGVHLRKLRVLDVSHNQVTTVDMELFEMPCLSSLNLSHNLLTSLPKFKKSCNLTRLDIGYNQFKQVPYSLVNCSSLNYLNLAFNEINRLPSWLASLEDLEDVRLEGVPLVDSNDKQGFKQTKQLLKVKLNNSQSVNELKVVVTGPSEMGKNQFLSFFDDDCQKDGFQSKKDESKPCFLRRSTWNGSDDLGDYQLNIWGITQLPDSQTSYIPIEPLLYTKFAIYAVVFDVNVLDVEIKALWAWLDAISMYGSPSCVVFVAYAQNEQHNHSVLSKIFPIVKHFSGTLMFSEPFLYFLYDQLPDIHVSKNKEAILRGIHEVAALLEWTDGQPLMGRLVQNTAITFKEEMNSLSESKSLGPVLLMEDMESVALRFKNLSIHETKNIASLAIGFLKDVGCLLKFTLSTAALGVHSLIIYDVDWFLSTVYKLFSQLEEESISIKGNVCCTIESSSIRLPHSFQEKHIHKKLSSLLKSVLTHSSMATTDSVTEQLSSVVEGFILLFIKHKLLLPVSTDTSPCYILPYHLKTSQPEIIVSEVPNFEMFNIKWRYTMHPSALHNRKMVDILDTILNRVVLDNVGMAVWLWSDIFLFKNHDSDVVFVSSSFSSITVSTLVFNTCFKHIKDIVAESLSNYEVTIDLLCPECIEDNTTNPAELSLDYCIERLRTGPESMVCCSMEHKMKASTILPHLALPPDVLRRAPTVVPCTSKKDINIAVVKRCLEKEIDFRRTCDEILLLQQYRSPCVTGELGILMSCVIQSAEQTTTANSSSHAIVTHIPYTTDTLEDILTDTFVSSIVLYRIAVQLAHALRAAPTLCFDLSDARIWSLNIEDAFNCSLAVSKVYDIPSFSPLKRLKCWKDVIQKIVNMAKSAVPLSMGKKNSVRYHVLEEILSGCKQLGDLNEVISTLSKVEAQLLSSVCSIFNQKQFSIESAHFVTRSKINSLENSFPEHFVPIQKLTEIWVPMVCRSSESEMALAVFKLGSDTLKTYSTPSLNPKQILAVIVCEKTVWISSLLDNNLSCVSIYDIDSRMAVHNIKLKNNAGTCFVESCGRVYLGTKAGFIFHFPIDVEHVKAEGFQPGYKRVSTTAISSIAVSQSMLWVSTTDSTLYLLSCNGQEPNNNLSLKQKVQLNTDEAFSHLLASTEDNLMYYYGEKAIMFFDSSSLQESPSELLKDGRQQCCFTLSEITDLVRPNRRNDDKLLCISALTEANGCLWVGLSTGHILILKRNKLLYHMQPYCTPVVSLCSITHDVNGDDGECEVQVLSFGRCLHTLFPHATGSCSRDEEKGGVLVLWNAPTADVLSKLILLENSSGDYLNSYQDLANMVHMGKFSDSIPFDKLAKSASTNRQLSSTLDTQQSQTAPEQSYQCFLEINSPPMGSTDCVELSFTHKPTYQCLVDRISQVVCNGCSKEDSSILLGYRIGQNKLLISLSSDTELDCYFDISDTRPPLVLL